MDTATQTTPASAAKEFISLVERGNWPAFKSGIGITADARSFLDQMAADAALEGFAGFAPADFLTVTHDFWAWGATRLPEQRLIRLRQPVGADGKPLPRVALEVIGQDMPFLVESLMAAVIEEGVAADALFHPIVPVRRDATGRRALVDGAESMIQVFFTGLSDAQGASLLKAVGEALDDVAAAVADFELIKRRMIDCAGELLAAASRIRAAPSEVKECADFLQWLAGGRFVLLGARDYHFARDDQGAFIQDEPIIVDHSGLGILRDPDRYVLRRGSEPSMITPEIRTFLEEADPILVAKSSFASRVHRRTTADYIGVKRYATDGQVVGETRFVGLFTSEAYNDNTRDIPLLRMKTARVIDRSGALPGSHNARVLQNILETYPRDELFQLDESALLANAVGILHLVDRPRTRVFLRRDRFNRFITALVYVPKERFNSDLRSAIGDRLTAYHGGHVAAFYPLLGDGPLARIHFLIQDIDKSRPTAPAEVIEQEVTALTRTWEDSFDEAVQARLTTPEGRNGLSRRFRSAFSAGYRERFSIEEALVDARCIAMAPDDIAVFVRTYRPEGAAPESLACKIYARGGALSLSSVLPVLENMGLSVDTETPFRVTDAAGGVFVIHDLTMRSADGTAIDYAVVEASFEDAFSAVWTKAADNDGFNRIILKLGVGWREAALVRALARYRTQTGLDPSPRVQEDALAAYPQITRGILDLFRLRFDPAAAGDGPARMAAAAAKKAEITALLDAVPSIDADRALRRIADLVAGIVRTNFYQRDAAGRPKAYMAFKIDSRALVDLPAPKPYREIWVFAPDVEGVHLRFGAVARGGLRWSDRRDDFRTEVLDLVKAQQVKNAIIVPVGAKGGFYPKLLPPRGAPGWFEAGQSAYVTFLQGLLDVTDNLIDGAIVSPPEVVRWDQEDPYLVVAADKGTATFSDLANSVAQRYGFWLDDAFASGGSAGYDHKAMGITAKGAWEAVKRHFRELGLDTQTQPFDVIGVGDMSGDVFGNGMLLSRTIRLIAAFDHRDIFIDPDPADPEAAWAERKRMFELPRSSWADYDRSLISAGGGVFSRAEKSIPLTPQMQALTGITAAQASPAQIINALLKARCDLLWFGGIGTFVKARRETHAEAGDRGNDALRVNAEDLQARVVGEGANLGVTQAARIAFARKGGKINTDAVDNSAGVDTSDHEVNIKILLAEAIRSGVLTAQNREPLLEQMTAEVAEAVLSDNYNQTLAVSLAEASAAADLDSHERFMLRLEAAGKLDRAVEGLAGAEEIRALREADQGFTRPELCKLIAYAKIDLFDALCASPLPDDPYLQGRLSAYFPQALSPLGPQMQAHRLRREIIATGLAGDVIDVMGPSFVDRVRETARVSPEAIAAAFEAAAGIFDLEALRSRINALDAKAPAQTQLSLHQELANALRRMTIYLARKRADAPIGETIARYKDGCRAQLQAAWDLLTPAEHGRAEGRLRQFSEAGAPEDLARDAAVLAPMVTALDVVDIAARLPLPAVPTAAFYRAIGAAFGIDRLRAAGLALSHEQHWDRLALRRTLEELFEDQRTLAEQGLAWAKMRGAALEGLDYAAAAALAEAWIDELGAVAEAPRQTLAELEAGGGWSFARTVLAAAELRALSTRLLS